MSLFAKNKPVKRLGLGDGNWVELRKLSKGFKDSLQSETADIAKGFNMKDDKVETNEIPEGLVQKIREIEYRKLAAAIVGWSDDAEISVENVKELDEEVYAKILEAVDEINNLSEAERKNS